MNKLAKIFGDNVKKQRKKRDISQEHLAHISKLDRSYMSRVERGVVRITLEKVYQIAIALDCEPSELLPNRKIPGLLDKDS
ncbi:helix-turn-helix transcriptional regulator [Teredinibacter turnerae]|uniref:helix-turn-helix domain-containing protein n=1 Tax=Teredinibacter turnerae TaxID=2426 RepID=UPI00036AADC7|nr:helix-turn-helix transcriptional regulator [Teredinibacter turnerae]